MDALGDVLAVLGLDDFSSESCQAYLNEPCGLFCEKSLSVELRMLSTIACIMEELREDDISDSLAIKRIAAFLVSVITNGHEPNILIGAARSLLGVCSLPGAAAFGAINIHSFLSISNTLLTVSIEATVAPAEKSSKKKVEYDEEMSDEGDDPFSQYDAAENDESVGRKGKGYGNGFSSKLIPSTMVAFLNDLRSQFMVFCQRSESLPLDTLIDGLGAAAFLSEVHSKYSECGAAAVAVLSLIALDSEQRTIAIIKSTIGALTITGRDQRIPDNSKARSGCHRAAVSLLVSLSKQAGQAAILWETQRITEEQSVSTVSKRRSLAPGSTASKPGNRIASSRAEGPPNSPGAPPAGGGSAPDSAGGLSTGATGNRSLAEQTTLQVSFVCIIGAMQRMVLLVPDRVPTRLLAMESIVEVLSVMQTTSYLPVTATAATSSLTSLGSKASDTPYLDTSSATPGTGLLDPRTPSRRSTSTGRSSKSQRHIIPGIETHGIQAVAHFLLFLSKLSRCSKVSHRAYSLDIITRMLGTSWIWEPLAALAGLPSLRGAATAAGLFSPSGTPQTPLAAELTMGPKTLLLTLVDRADDAAPTVRIRALSALTDLIETLSLPEPPRCKCDLLLRLVLGFDSTSDDIHDLRSKNLLDLLRIRASDDRPLVRSKTLQALGLTLSLKWPKYEPVLGAFPVLKPLSPAAPAVETTEVFAADGDEISAPESGREIEGVAQKVEVDSSGQRFKLEYINMFISDEDIAIFIECCSDRSLSVRKQAVTSLTALTRSRPADAALQEAWVGAVLPVITDPETTAQVKVAFCVYDLIIDKILAWAENLQAVERLLSRVQRGQGQRGAEAARGGLATADQTRQIASLCEEMRANAAVWQLLNRVSVAGHTKLLRSCIVLLLRQGIIKVEAKLTKGAGTTTGVNAPRTTMTAIMNASRLACCFGLDNAVEDGTSSGGGGVSGDYLGRGGGGGGGSHPDDRPSQAAALPSIRDQDQETIAKAGWVLLEALIGEQLQHDGTSVGASYSSALDPSGHGDQGSADFVVRCFMRKRAGKQVQAFSGLSVAAVAAGFSSSQVMDGSQLSQMSLSQSQMSQSQMSQSQSMLGQQLAEDLDDDEMRMLRVLEKLAMSVSSADLVTMREVLLSLLLGLSLSAPAAGVTIAALFAMSKAHAKKARPRAAAVEDEPATRTEPQSTAAAATSANSSEGMDDDKRAIAAAAVAATADDDDDDDEDDDDGEDDQDEDDDAEDAITAAVGESDGEEEEDDLAQMELDDDDSLTLRRKQRKKGSGGSKGRAKGAGGRGGLGRRQRVGGVPVRRLGPTANRQAAAAAAAAAARDASGVGSMTGEQLVVFYADVQQWSGQLMCVLKASLELFVWRGVPPVRAKEFKQEGSQGGQRGRTGGSSPSQSLSQLEDSLLPFAPLPGPIRRALRRSDSEAAKRVSMTALYLVGELSMLGFAVEEDEARPPPSPAVLLAQSGGKNKRGEKASLTLPQFTISEVSKAFKLIIPESLITLVQLLMGHYLPVNRLYAKLERQQRPSQPSSSQGTGNDLSQATSAPSPADSPRSFSSAAAVAEAAHADTAEVSAPCPPELRAHAFVAMGKLCLRDKARATDHVNVFLRELNPVSAAAAKRRDLLREIVPSSHSSAGAMMSKSVAGADDVATAGAGDVSLSSSSSSRAASGSLTAAREGGDNADSDDLDHEGHGLVLQSSPAVRSNALLVLGDLCVRYTSLVDRHVGSMAVCLQDENAIVRRHALILLTQLLLQDYLKWRGMLLFRFLATIVDKDAEMAEFSGTLLTKTILSKYPDFFCQHLTEAVIVFNSWVDHPAYVAAQAAGSDGGSCAVTMDGINLQGQARKKTRLQLYTFMMEGFTEEQKIHVTAKLVQDVLSHGVDTAYSLVGGGPSSSYTSSSSAAYSAVAAAASAHISDNNSDAGSVAGGGSYRVTLPFEDTLEDCFLLLQSPQLKVGKKAGADDGPDEGGEEETTEEGGSVALAKAKSKVLKKLSRQHLMSHVLPVLVSLKHALEAAKSRLQGSLMEFLVALVRSNKTEVDQALSSDPTLKAEIDYDIRMFEKAKEHDNLKRHAHAIEVAHKTAEKAPLAQRSALSGGHSHHAQQGVSSSSRSVLGRGRVSFDSAGLDAAAAAAAAVTADATSSSGAPSSGGLGPVTGGGDGRGTSSNDRQLRSALRRGSHSSGGGSSRRDGRSSVGFSSVEHSGPLERRSHSHRAGDGDAGDDAPEDLADRLLGSQPSQQRGSGSGGSCGGGSGRSGRHVQGSSRPAEETGKAKQVEPVSVAATATTSASLATDRSGRGRGRGRGRGAAATAGRGGRPSTIASKSASQRAKKKINSDGSDDDNGDNDDGDDDDDDDREGSTRHYKTEDRSGSENEEAESESDHSDKNEESGAAPSAVSNTDKPSQAAHGRGGRGGRGRGAISILSSPSKAKDGHSLTSSPESQLPTVDSSGPAPAAGRLGRRSLAAAASQKASFSARESDNDDDKEGAEESEGRVPEKKRARGPK